MEKSCETCAHARLGDLCAIAKAFKCIHNGSWAYWAPKEVDMVNHPPHYTQGGIECIDAIRAALTEEEFRGYCKGAAIKYIWRERHKGQNESLKKCVWYLNKLTEKK